MTRLMDRAILTKPKRQPKSYGSGGYVSGSGKPCPTCYAPMSRVARTEDAGRKGRMAIGETWACTKHGEPTRP